jgi:hypothetical protein
MNTSLYTYLAVIRLKSLKFPHLVIQSGKSAQSYITLWSLVTPIILCLRLFSMMSVSFIYEHVT